MQEYRLLIGGQLCEARDGARYESRDPGTGNVVATAPAASEADVDDAVAAARRAFDDGRWSGLSPEQRAESLIELADAIQAEITSLAMIEALDSGGLVSRTAADVHQGARFLRTMAKTAARSFPWEERIPSHDPMFPSVNVVRREPMGVCAAIIPWNFPLLMACWKIGMATAAGNTVVLKPSPETPLSALALGAIVARSRVPAGVINIVTGPGRSLGERLCRHPDVDRVAFTGSTAVGKEVLRACSETLKRVSLELGGKSANIVLDDADLDLALDGALFATFLHSGQVCESGTRLLVPEKIHDDFVAKLVERARKLAVGYQLDPRTRVGPVVNARQRETVERYVEAGRREGARLVCGGERAGVAGFDGGFYVQPTIFADVDNAMTIAKEEIFGPVLSVIRYRSDDEAIAIANASSYGLAGGVWSRDLARARRVAERLRAGTTWINDWHVFSDLGPFGGYKQSGIGREMGKEGLAEYTEIKHVHIGTEGDPNAKIAHRLLIKRPRPLGFELEATTRVVSGPGSVARLLGEIASLGRSRALLVTDRGVASAGLVDRVRRVLGSAVVAVFDEVPQDSALEAIDAAAAAGRDARADVVVSLGGGSVIDTAKATLVALTNDIRAIETIGMNQLTGPQMPHVVVPTTAGTGSEVTNVAVVKNRRLGIKTYVIDRFVVPDVAILDPELTIGLPAAITAATGFDALTHAIEAFTSKIANPMTDAHALGAIRLIARWLPRAVAKGDDLEARSGMQNAATMAGWAILGAGVGLVHGMSHAIGARHGVPHGTGNAILLPHVMRWAAESEPAAKRFVDVAAALGVETKGLSPRDAALRAAGRVAELLAECRHPSRLSDVGLAGADLEAAAPVAFVDLTNLTAARRPIHPGEVAAIYAQAL